MLSNFSYTRATYFQFFYKIQVSSHEDILSNIARNKNLLHTRNYLLPFSSLFSAPNGQPNLWKSLHIGLLLNLFLRMFKICLSIKSIVVNSSIIATTLCWKLCACFKKYNAKVDDLAINNLSDAKPIFSALKVCVWYTIWYQNPFHFTCHNTAARCTWNCSLQYLIALSFAWKSCLLWDSCQLNRKEHKRILLPTVSFLLSYRQRIDWNSDTTAPSFIAIKTQKNSIWRNIRNTRVFLQRTTLPRAAVTQWRSK